jgi:hypothetical protein
MSQSINPLRSRRPMRRRARRARWAQAPARVAWRHIALFAFLSYAIAWALILPFIPNVFDLIRADETPAELDISIVPVFAMFAPMIAALVMRMFVSKEGLKGSLGPRPPARSCAGLIRSQSGSSRSARASLSTPSTTRATAITTWDGASWVCRGWRRSSYDGG